MEVKHHLLMASLAISFVSIPGCKSRGSFTRWKDEETANHQLEDVKPEVNSKEDLFFSSPDRFIAALHQVQHFCQFSEIL